MRDPWTVTKRCVYGKSAEIDSVMITSGVWLRDTAEHRAHGRDDVALAGELRIAAVRRCDPRCLGQRRDALAELDQIAFDHVERVAAEPAERGRADKPAMA